MKYKHEWFTLLFFFWSEHLADHTSKQSSHWMFIELLDYYWICSIVLQYRLNVFVHIKRLSLLHALGEQWYFRNMNINHRIKFKRETYLLLLLCVWLVQVHFKINPQMKFVLELFSQFEMNARNFSHSRKQLERKSLAFEHTQNMYELRSFVYTSHDPQLSLHCNWNYVLPKTIFQKYAMSASRNGWKKKQTNINLMFVLFRFFATKNK